MSKTQQNVRHSFRDERGFEYKRNCHGKQGSNDEIPEREDNMFSCLIADPDITARL